MVGVHLLFTLFPHLQVVKKIVHNNPDETHTERNRKSMTPSKVILPSSHRRKLFKRKGFYGAVCYTEIKQNYGGPAPLSQIKEQQSGVCLL